jgi:hypothetical protein
MPGLRRSRWERDLDNTAGDVVVTCGACHHTTVIDVDRVGGWCLAHQAFSHYGHPWSFEIKSPPKPEERPQ